MEQPSEDEYKISDGSVRVVVALMRVKLYSVVEAEFDGCPWARDGAFTVAVGPVSFSTRAVAEHPFTF